MTVTRSVLLFVLAAFAEISGAFVAGSHVRAPRRLKPTRALRTT